MRALASFLVLSVVATSARAEPAWEISDRWHCRTQSVAACEAGQDCQRYASEELREVNFATSQVITLGLDQPHEPFFPLPIISRDYQNHTELPDGTYVHFGKWTLIAMFAQQDRPEVSSLRLDFQLLAASPIRSTISFGECWPVPH
jgi:hypothetical protein